MSKKYDYYQTHYREYHQRTFSIDPSSYLEPFAGRLAPRCRILDIGCGSGRDLLWLKGKGFEVSGFESSPGLAGIARKMTECTVIEGDFELYDFSGLSTDAILASGSLVHLPHHRLSQVIQRIIDYPRLFKTSLKPLKILKAQEKGHLTVINPKLICIFH
ncbi:MAG: methyltransferase domain-containing protein [Deltaproteobacteria bacterium]|nr:methyltransferase domain-containing protein [Deltaproteobacteria bacterium]